MIKQYLRKVSLALLGLLLTFSGFSFLPEKQIAEAQGEKITYVAFGDSIAKGYAINLKTRQSDEEIIKGDVSSYEMIENSYVDLISKNLSENYTTTAYNFSKSGDKCQDMIDFIGTFFDEATGEVKNASEYNSRFTSLTNEQVYNACKRANIITVCIGANNLLKNAGTLMSNFLGLTSPTITQAELENAMKESLFGNDNIKGFEKEFISLLSLLDKLNPNANIYFTDIYNPYKVADANPSTLSLAQSFGYTRLTQANLNIISKTAETSIGGGTYSDNSTTKGLNGIIKDEIKNFNTSNSTSRFKYVSTKASFDGKYDVSNKKTYNDYVNTRLDEVTISTFLSGINKVISEYLDPHPTYKGHELIFQSYQNENLVPVIPEEHFVINTLINEKEVKEGYSLNEGESITITTSVENEGYAYSYDYSVKDSSTGQVVLTSNSSSLTLSHESLSAGEYKIYLTISAKKGLSGKSVCSDKFITNLTIKETTKFTVDFNTCCEDVNPPQSQLVKEGEKANEPTISRKNFVLVGWFTEQSYENLWDFESTVNKNMTLFAKWKEILKISVSINGQTIVKQLEEGKNILDLKNEMSEEISSSLFLGFMDINGNELNDEHLLCQGEKVVAKFVSLTCLNPAFQNQEISANITSVKFHVDAKKSSSVKWLVDDEIVYKLVVTDGQGASWSFAPPRVGEYKISCMVDNVLVSSKTVKLIFSIPTNLTIGSTSLGNNVFKFEVQNAQYCDGSKFVWYKSYENKGSEKVEEIGRGKTLNYTASSSCKIFVKFIDNNGGSYNLSSNEIQIKIETQKRGMNIYLLICIPAGILAIISVVILVNKRSYKKYLDY